MSAIWLLKTEPDTFSIDDLRACPDGTSGWDGVRNYQARNRLRDEMQEGDCVLIYHSSCAQPAIVGEACVVSAPTRTPASLKKTQPGSTSAAAANNHAGIRWISVICVPIRNPCR